MALERIIPNMFSVISIWPDNIAAIQDDPDAPNATWLTAATNTSPSAEIQFAEPAGNLISANTSEFRVLVRKVGGSSATTITIEVRDNGAVIATPVSAQTVTSTTGQIFSFTVPQSSLTNNGMNTALYITTVGGGGSPSARSAVELGAVEWNADTISLKSATDSSGLRVTEASSIVTTDVIPKAITDLSDQFTTIDPAKWTSTATLNAGVVDFAAGKSLYTNGPYDTENSFIWTEITRSAVPAALNVFSWVIQEGSQTNTSLSSNAVTVELYSASGTDHRIRLHVKQNDAASAMVYSGVYDPTNHRYVGIQRVGGNMDFKVSADGVNWSTLHGRTYSPNSSIFHVTYSAYTGNTVTYGVNQIQTQQLLPAETFPGIDGGSIGVSETTNIVATTPPPSTMYYGYLSTLLRDVNGHVPLSNADDPYTGDNNSYIGGSSTGRDFGRYNAGGFASTSILAYPIQNTPIGYGWYMQGLGGKTIKSDSVRFSYTVTSSTTQGSYYIQVAARAWIYNTDTNSTSEIGFGIGDSILIDDLGSVTQSGVIDIPITLEKNMTSLDKLMVTLYVVEDEGNKIAFTNSVQLKFDWGEVAVKAYDPPPTTKSGTDAASLSLGETSAIVPETAGPPSDPIAGSDAASLGVSETATLLVSSVVAGSDTSAISITDTSHTLKTISATDSAALGVAEATSGSRTFAVNDVASISITESVNTGKDAAVPGSDTVALGITEQAQVASTRTVTDTSAITVTESRSILSTAARTDAAAITATESVALLKTITASDSASISITESSSTGGNSLVPGNDGAALGVTEQASVFVVQSASETTALGLTESRVNNVSVIRSDSTVISAAETTSSLKTIAATDTTGLLVTETASLGGETQVPGVDAIALGVVESRVIDVAVSTNDAVGIGVTETTVTNKPKTAADNTAISAAESTALFKTLTANESLSLGIAESTATYINATKTASDVFALGVSETVNTYSDKPGTDSSSLSVSETASVVTSGGIEITASDSATIGLSEGTARTIGIIGSDAASIGVAESTGSSRTLAASDSASLRAAESHGEFVTSGATDNLPLAVTEATAFGGVSHNSDDTTGLKVTETSSIYETLSVSTPGTDEASITVTETTEIVSDWKAVAGSDSDSLSVQETAHHKVFASDSDAIDLRVSETVAFGDIAFATSDALSLNVDEGTHLSKPVEASDSVDIALIDSGSLSAHEGFVALFVSDDLRIVFNDNEHKWNLGGVNIPIRFATNSEHGTIISSAAKHGGLRFGTSTERIKRF